MINYIQRFAGGKVSIEVSDPADIQNLSTLYADGSEARVVNISVGVYRLINGVWTLVPGSGQYFIVNFNRRDGEEITDKTFEEISAAYNAGMLIVFRDADFGSSIADYFQDTNTFVSKHLYMDISTDTITGTDMIKEFGILQHFVAPDQISSSVALAPRIPIIKSSDNGKVLGVSGYAYELVELE